ncbi:DUF4142 domain-containing protein [Paracoccus sp. S-4012]|uniref:DUF4142 domain-containing protein n=1 Tax=Paracoccus sp. S-4012 TaxID=2665648 RepID=UPI0012B0D16C|nr:DUF4142 domain-containing protein [Paracoccus sp. S-4012]MRX51285.1 DUF4142 domain-containing protein [Paracoccus sp. S-4012]
MRAAALALALAAAPAPGLAQMGNPGFMAPDTRFDAQGMPEPGQTNPNDILFAQLAAEGGMAEVALSELAEGRAQAEAVTAFAARMIEDHTAANERLAGLAEAADIPLPEALNAEHKAIRGTLEGLEGAAFDIAYMRGQVVDHQKAATLMVWEIADGQEAGLQGFASETLPVILRHLEEARAIVADLSAQPEIAAVSPETIGIAPSATAAGWEGEGVTSPGDETANPAAPSPPPPAGAGAAPADEPAGEGATPAEAETAPAE